MSIARGVDEGIWSDLDNPVEMVERFAKLETGHQGEETYAGGAPSGPTTLAGLGQADRLGWNARLSLSELEELFDVPTDVGLAGEEAPVLPQEHPPAPQGCGSSTHDHRHHHHHHHQGYLHRDVRVTLLHRTRVAQGCEWQVVVPKEEIRVTRNRGKLFKVLVESSVPFTKRDVHLFLTDSTSSTTSRHSSPSRSLPSESSSYSSSESSPSTCSPLQVSEQDLVVQSIEEVQRTEVSDGRTVNYSVEVKVKLCLIGKGIHIGARLSPPQPGQPTYVGRSVEFMTHNNGKQKLRSAAKKKKTKGKKDDQKQQQQQQQQREVNEEQGESHTNTSGGPSSPVVKQENEESMYDTAKWRRESDDYISPASSNSDSDDLASREHSERPPIPIIAPYVYSGAPPQQPAALPPRGPIAAHEYQLHGGSRAMNANFPQQATSFFAASTQQQVTIPDNGSIGPNVGTAGSIIDSRPDIGHVAVLDTATPRAPTGATGAAMSQTKLTNTEANVPTNTRRSFGPSSSMMVNFGGGGGGGGGGGNMPNPEWMGEYAWVEQPVIDYRCGRKRRADQMGGGNGGGRRPYMPQHAPYPDHLTIHGGLHVEGVVRAQGFMQYSDLRLKTNVEDIVDAVNLISQLEGKRYRWKEKEEIQLMAGKAPISLQNNGGMKVIGLIAQQVQRVLPEAVREDEDGFLSVDYIEIIPVLIEAFNQHLEQYHQQQKELKSEFENWRLLLDNKGDAPTQKMGPKEVVTEESNQFNRRSTDMTESDMDSFDQSSGAITDVEADENDEDASGRVDVEENAYDERGSLLVVDLDEMVADKRGLARLAAQMNKLIPDRQYIDLLQYVREQKVKDRKRDKRLFFLFLFACLTLLAVNVAIAIGVPIAITYLVQNHL